MALEHRRNPVEQVYGDVTQAPLDIAEIGAVHVSVRGQVLLRDTARRSDPAQIKCDQRPPMHGRERTALDVPEPPGIPDRKGGLTMKLWLLLAGISLLSGTATATTKPLSTAKLSGVVRQRILSAAVAIRDRGTSGLRVDLERCYRRVSRTHDQTAAVYCVTQDRYAVESTDGAFPGAEDPFFNWNRFASRAAKAVDQTVEPASARVTFISALGAAQAVELKIIVKQLGIKPSPSQ